MLMTWRDEVACELRWSPDYAKSRLMRATTQVVDTLPRLLELHERGEVSAVHGAAVDVRGPRLATRLALSSHCSSRVIPS